MINSQHDHRCGDAVLEQAGFGNLGSESVQHQKIDVDRKSASLSFLDHGPKDLVVKGIAKSGETVRNDCGRGQWSFSRAHHRPAPETEIVDGSLDFFPVLRAYAFPSGPYVGNCPT